MQKISNGKVEIDGEIFEYRYFKNENAKETVVLLVGGIGLSDLIYTHFEKLSKDFSVITFDYHIKYNTNEKLIFAIKELLVSFNIKAWFIGQSLGGFIAQLIAFKYPEVTKGLVLSNTGTLSKDMNEEAIKSLTLMIKSTNKTKRMLKFIPFSIFKKMITNAIFKKYSSDFNEEEKYLLKNLCDIMQLKLTKKYELHMLNLLIDMENHLGVSKSNFVYLKDRVLLILSEDDKTFSDDVKNALIDLTPSPKLVTDLKGGHLALLVNCDEYIKIIKDYIKSSNET